MDICVKMRWHEKYKIHTGNKYFLKHSTRDLCYAASTTEIVLIFLLQNSLQTAFLHVDANIGKIILNK